MKKLIDATRDMFVGFARSLSSRRRSRGGVVIKTGVRAGYLKKFSG
jgi:hypothetical protein